MADFEVSPEAVQAGLDAFNREFAFGATAEMVEAILKGAAPYIEAAYAERKGKEISATADAFLRAGKKTKGQWFGHIGGQLLADASNIRNGKPRS